MCTKLVVLPVFREGFFLTFLSSLTC